MFFRFVLLGISLVLLLFIFDILVPKLKLKYRLYKELKEKQKRQQAFKKKMEKSALRAHRSSPSAAAYPYTPSALSN